MEINRHSLPPEAQLLLHCARVQMDAACAERVAALARGGVDWSRVLTLAGQHRLRPLLYRNLKAVCPDAVPPETLSRLRDFSRANAMRNFALVAELVAILRVFETNGIAAIPYKGPVLAASVYRDQALREIRDLDILVRKEDVLRARDLLMTRGYEPLRRWSPDQAKAFLESGYAYELASVQSRITVELHWRILPAEFGIPLTLPTLADNLETLALGNAQMQVLPPETTLVVLCLHGARHAFGELFSLCDIAELTRVYPNLNWESVLSLAARLHARRMLLTGLSAAREFFQASLPAQIVERIETDSKVQWLVPQIQKQLEQTAPVQNGLFRFPMDNVQYHLRDRWQDVARFYFQRVFKGDWILYRLPRFLFPLYYVIRPFRLAAIYAHKLAERLGQALSSWFG